MRPCEGEKQIIRGTYSNLSSILYAPFHYITKGFTKTSSKCLTSDMLLGTFFYKHLRAIVPWRIKLTRSAMLRAKSEGNP